MHKVEVRERHLWIKWYPEHLCQAGWQGERLWNPRILSAHSYPSTHQVSVLAVHLIHFPEHAKGTSLSWWGLPVVFLCVGTHLLHAALEKILKASSFCQICSMFSHFNSFSKFAWNFPSLIPFPPILSYNSMRKDEFPKSRSLDCSWGCRNFLPEQRGLVLMRAHGSFLISNVSLIAMMGLAGQERI